MNPNRNQLVIVLGILFVLAAGYVVYAGRPVMKLQNQQVATTTPTAIIPVVTPATTTGSVASTTTVAATTTSPATTPTKPKGVYAMSDVQAHGNTNDCWSAINGSVYDLTTWINRHPGGSAAIEQLCGTDGSAMYNNQHGSRGRPQSMLALLKIGTLE